MGWRSWIGWPEKPVPPQGPTTADLLAQIEALQEYVRLKVPPPPKPIGSEPRVCSCGHTSAQWVQRVADGFVECLDCYQARMKDELGQQLGS